MSLTWIPGTNPTSGLLYVLFGKDVSPAELTVLRGEEPLTLRGAGTAWQKGHEKFAVKPGIVLIPPRGEATRMRELGEDGVTTSEQRDHLIEMGYIEEDEPEDSEKSNGEGADAP